MNAMPMASPAASALTGTAMMVAMMLPSLAPTVWRYRGYLRSRHVPDASRRAILFSAGYSGVWAAIGLAVFAISAELSPMITVSSLAPWLAGVIVLCAGSLQRSGWKSRRLVRCRRPREIAAEAPRGVRAAWRDGCRLGIDCGLSCAAPMAILIVAGLMDARPMALITLAITVERVAPSGVRIARLTGSVAVVAGFVMCVRAIA